jgi:uncharacterized membrane protein YdfJ with MMPL/SSD domain
MYERDGYAVFEIQQPAADNDARTQRWLDHLRSTSWPAGIGVRLGGEAPAQQDFLRILLGDFPLIFGTVVGLTFVLLGLAFRSLVMSIKAVLMNLLSIGAAMGVLTWAFQEGHLAGPLDFRAAGFVDATAPVVIFAGLFGISMDYEVFLISRIREEWRSGRSNAGAVAAGIERTGQIITSAALILVVVVGSLAFSHLSFTKGAGVTFAVAILLDATVIRLLLVPAMMRALGDLNWWPGGRRRAGEGGRTASLTLRWPFPFLPHPRWAVAVAGGLVAVLIVMTHVAPAAARLSPVPRPVAAPGCAAGGSSACPAPSSPPSASGGEDPAAPPPAATTAIQPAPPAAAAQAPARASPPRAHSPGPGTARSAAAGPAPAPLASPAPLPAAADSEQAESACRLPAWWWWWWWACRR